MAVRNFWVEADVDGYQTMVQGGPRSKDGGMDVVVYVRNEGRIETACKVFCRAYGEKLIVEVSANDKQVAKIETKR